MLNALITVLVCTVLLLLVFLWQQLKANTKLKQQLTSSSEQPHKSEIAKNQPDRTIKYRYLSSISHELRTPLNVVMGYAQLLEKQAKDDDEHKEKYTLMRHNCEHLAHLVEGILEFSAIESGRLKVQAEWVNLSDLLKQLILMFETQATQKSLTFKTAIDEKLPQTVKTDHKRLQQILINLLSNAIKFTDQGTINFTVTYRNQVATFIIKDTGYGIDEADIERIFIPFERIEKTNHQISGTGLGLPITQMLAELLGGELQVRSKPGQGSTFTFKMMLAPQTGLDHNTVSTEKSIKNEPSLNKNHQLLIVDDDENHRHLMIDILKPLGCSIDQAQDGAVAKDMLQQKVYDLVLVDVAMPVMDGWQLAHWVNQNQAQTKIIMLSGNPRDLENNQAIHYDNYLTKPVNLNQLLNQISDSLGLKPKTTQPIRSTPSLAKLRLNPTDFAALQNMLQIGHVNGLTSYLTAMYEDNRINTAEHDHLMKLVKDMNLSQLNQLIKPS